MSTNIGKSPDSIPPDFPTQQLPSKKSPPLPKRPSPKEVSAFKTRAASTNINGPLPDLQKKGLSEKHVSPKPTPHQPIGPRPRAPVAPIKGSITDKTKSAPKVQEAVRLQGKVLPLPKMLRPAPPTKSSFREVDRPLMDTFKDENGTVIATEKATLVNTKDLVIRQLSTKLEYLIKLRDSGDKRYDEQIKEGQEQLGLYEKELGTWASTNAPRFAFQTLGKEEAQKRYMPALGNFWMQTLHNREGVMVSRVGRSAAVTDFSHGRVSLKELEDYQDLVRLAKDKPDIKEERAIELVAIYNLGRLANTNPLSINPKCRENLNKLILKLKKRIAQDYGDQVKNSDGSLKPEEISKITASRKDKLQQQILQDLFVHFQTRPVDKNEIVYGRTALIDSIKKSVKEPSGFINSERTQMLDMHAIYSSLNPAKIFFDVEDSPNKGPYFDNNGNIHMNRSFYRGKNPKEPVTMNTVFLNISAQGNTRNAGMQKAINDKALVDLTTMAKKGLVDSTELEELRASLEDPRSDSFEKSLLAIQMISKAGYASEDCFGGKDRTGYAVALLTSARLEEEQRKQNEEINKTLKVEILDDVESVMLRWDKQLLSEEGIAAKIIKYNTGHKILKLTKYNLALYHTGTRKGMARRIADMFKGVRVLFAPKTIPQEVGKRQLYSPFEHRIPTATRLELDK